MIIENLLFFIISAIVLAASGTYLVKNLIKISHFLKISEFAAAFIIMAMATAMPELFVGISSAVSKVPTLSLGNLLGASILDLTLVMGILIIIAKKIQIKSKKVIRDSLYITASSILLIALFLIGKSFSRIDGIILIAAFILNTFIVLKQGGKKERIIKVRIIESKILIEICLFIVSFVILFFASQFIIKYANLLAIDLGLPQIIIGLFLISFATVLPELIVGIRAIEMKHSIISIGDQLGAIIHYVTLIIGIVALICPFTSAIVPFLTSAIFIVFASLIFSIFAKTGKELSIKEGIILIFLYVLFMVLQFFLK